MDSFTEMLMRGWAGNKAQTVGVCEPPLKKRGVQGLPATRSHVKLQQRLHKSSKLILLCLPLQGEALLESNTIIDHVYCSPSLRCVQTAYNILKG